ncbi:MAG: transketolase [Chlamydiales bacterium]|nr:transketolase [Chlamydiales bacterium]
MVQQTANSVDKPLDEATKQILMKVANTIRGLSMDAVQKADSGHPGLPMGCAEMGAYLFGEAMRYNAKNAHWPNRDVFILSAGHGSMLLYSCLHLAGYKVSLEDLKNFRQLHSNTPGHPESLDTEGVETTTGPLGQGFGNAVGMALGYKICQEKFNTPEYKIFDNKVYALVSDGCIMEGCTSEVSSLAGHLKLDNLIVLYDSNHITLDGQLSDSCSEDTKMRYLAYGWDVQEVNGNDLEQLHTTLDSVRQNQTRPTLVICTTIIGKGSPHKANSSKAHGSPLGEDEVKATKIALGIPLEDFYVPQAVTDFFAAKIPEGIALEEKWKKDFESWSRTYPEKRKEYDTMKDDIIPSDIEEKLSTFAIKGPTSGRKASQDVTNFLADFMPQLYSGSADLSSSDYTMIKKFPLIATADFKGRNIKFGIREFGMATMATGMSQTHMILPYIGTFLTFSDYMRNAIRLASLMKTKVIYQFTHDSIFLGEDGPTHQPIEQLSSLRAIPNLHVLRPSGIHEVKMAWVAALKYNGPSCLILSRQNVADLPETVVPYDVGVGRGGYIVKRESAKAAFTLIATGSELPLAMEVAVELEKLGKPARVVSMPCTEIFDKQPEEYRNSVLGGDIGRRVSVEAASDMTWYKYIGLDGIPICMESFGASAPASVLAKEFGFTVDAILERLL